MKMTMFLVIVGMILPMVSHSQQVEEAEPQKVYLESSQLAIVDREILAFVEGQWISVNAVYSDPLGLYVAYSKYPRTRWTCRECGYNNYGGDETCQKVDEITGKKCGKPRPPG